MKLFKKLKDGGPKSRVWGYFLIEWKSLFSIVLLHFRNGSREAFHSHAFNSVSWVLSGQLIETRIQNAEAQRRAFLPSPIPVITTRDNLHKVVSIGNTWVISFRGPWADQWQEIDEAGDLVTLTDGRRELDRVPYWPNIYSEVFRDD